jgi:hypothetical protein
MIERITMESRPAANFSCLIHTRAFTRGGMGLEVAASVTVSFSFAVRRRRLKVMLVQMEDAPMDTSRSGHQIPG